MTEDELDRLDAELHRRVAAQIETYRRLMAAEARGDLDTVAEAEEAAYLTGIALAELAIGSIVRNRMGRAIKPLDNQPDDPETNHRRKLMMLERFHIDLRSLGIPDLADLAAADALRNLNGEEGQLLCPLDTGPGPKGFNPIDLHLIRRYVLRVIVECARTGKTRKQFLHDAQPYAADYHQFRDWLPRIPSEERVLAKKIGKALRDGRPLSSGQAALWAEIAEIKDDDLRKIFGYVQGLDPEKVLAARRA